jgi:hypothetical protein
MAFAEPAGVKALKPTVCPCLIIAAASCAVTTGKGKCMKFSFKWLSAVLSNHRFQNGSALRGSRTGAY